MGLYHRGRNRLFIWLVPVIKLKWPWGKAVGPSTLTFQGGAFCSSSLNPVPGLCFLRPEERQVWPLPSCSSLGCLKLLQELTSSVSGIDLCTRDRKVPRARERTSSIGNTEKFLKIPQAGEHFCSCLLEWKDLSINKT